MCIAIPYSTAALIRLQCRAQLLHIDPSTSERVPSKREDRLSLDDTDTDAPRIVEPHPDERQVRLDTDRSFVLYPVGETLPRQRPRPPHLLTCARSLCRRHGRTGPPAERAARPDCRSIQEETEAALFPGASSRRNGKASVLTASAIKGIP